MFKIKGLEIFATGTWNGDSYTLEDLNNMVSAFGDVGFTPPLKLGHTEDQTFLQKDGLPAAGWIDRIFVKGGKLLADISGIPKKVFELLQNKAYRHVSSEIFWNLKRNGQTFPRALKAVALLGAETPAVSGLTPIDQMLSQYLAAFEADSEDIKAYQFETDVNIEVQDKTETDNIDILLYAAKGIQFVIGKKIGETATSTQTVIFTKADWTIQTAKQWLQQNNMRSDKVDETTDSLRFRQVDPNAFQPGSFRTITPGATNTATNAGHDKKKKKKLNTNEGDVMTIEELQALMAEMKAKQETKETEYAETVAALKTALETKDTEVAGMATTLNIIKRNAEIEAAKVFTASLVTEGKLAPAITEKVNTFLVALSSKAENIKVYKEGEENATDVSLVNYFKQIFTDMPKIVDFNENAPQDTTSKEGDPMDILDKKITEYAEKHSVSYGEAAGPVLAANPGLADKYYN